jgi:hypothetical protein
MRALTTPDGAVVRRHEVCPQHVVGSNRGAARIGSWSPLGEKLGAASANRSLRAGCR